MRAEIPPHLSLEGAAGCEAAGLQHCYPRPQTLPLAIIAPPAWT